MRRPKSTLADLPRLPLFFATFTAIFPPFYSFHDRNLQHYNKEEVM